MNHKVSQILEILNISHQQHAGGRQLYDTSSVLQMKTGVKQVVYFSVSWTGLVKADMEGKNNSYFLQQPMTSFKTAAQTASHGNVTPSTSWALSLTHTQDWPVSLWLTGKEKAGWVHCLFIYTKLNYVKNLVCFTDDSVPLEIIIVQKRYSA